MSTVIIPPKSLPKGIASNRLSAIKNAFTSLFSSKNEMPEEFKRYAPDTTRVSLPKNRFLEAAARVFGTKHYAASATSEAPYGYFRERHIIGDCTRFHGGIFLSHHPREAVVIDECYGVLASILDILKTRIEGRSSSPHRAEYEVYNEVIALVGEVIRIDGEATREFSRRENIQPDEKISLDVYVTQGFGLELHQVLLAGYLLEKLAEEKIIAGVVSLDSTLSDDTPSEEILLYTSSSGSVLKFCPNQKRIAELFH